MLNSKLFTTFAPEFRNSAQMAELVDALVSNTNGAIRAGSIPALGTRKGFSKAKSPADWLGIFVFAFNGPFRAFR